MIFGGESIYPVSHGPAMQQIIPAFLLLFSSALVARAEWYAGTGSVDITPSGPVPLAGYGGQTRLPSRVEHPIHLKAAAFRFDKGQPHVLVTADLVGLSRRMVDEILARAKRTHGLNREQLILNCSHNHSCPITADVLWLYYDLTREEEKARNAYTEKVYLAYVEVIGRALSNLEPAELSFSQGLAGIAVNRRRSRPGGKPLPGPVDQDVPVLVIHTRGGKGPKGILFGYSCHTTALSGTTINGDYAGYAQIELEKRYPGSLALFVQNCGGDANPLPRLMTQDSDEALALASSYGKILAEGVVQAMAGTQTKLDGPLASTYGKTELLLQPGKSAAQLRSDLPKSTGLTARANRHLLRQWENGGPPDRVPYPIQVWSFGKGLHFFALTGETVVDYSLRLKREHGFEKTWVAGYNNDLLSYVPSRRVLLEGGYEGTDGMLEYGHRGPYLPDVEERIIGLANELAKAAMK